MLLRILQSYIFFCNFLCLPQIGCIQGWARRFDNVGCVGWLVCFFLYFCTLYKFDNNGVYY